MLATQLLRRLPGGDAKSQNTDKSATSSAASAVSESASPASAAAEKGEETAESLVLPAESLYASLRDEQLFVVFISSASNEFLLYKQQTGDPQNAGLVCWSERTKNTFNLITLTS